MATGEVIQLPHVRLSFAKLVEARAFEEGQDKRFEANFLLDPSNAIHADKIKLIKASAKALVKEVCDGKVPSDVVYCFGPGEDKDYDGYEDMWYIASNKKLRDGRVTIVNRKGDPVHGHDDEEFPYSGCYVDATISLWSMSHKKWGKKVQANLRAIRFCANGDAFSSVKPVTEDEFDGMESSDDFGDFDDSKGDDEGDPLA